MEAESRDLGRLAESIHWLGSMRALPERAVPLFGSSNFIQANGAGTIPGLVMRVIVEDDAFDGRISRGGSFTT